MGQKLPSAMKWHGWGHPHATFPMHERPNLWPFIRKKLSLKGEVFNPPVPLESIVLPAFVSNDIEKISLELTAIVGEGSVSSKDFDRLVHAFGKSFPDLWRARRGLVERAPDLVVWPSSHEQVVKLVDWCKKNQWQLIPFGGGTNIVGALDVRESASCPVISLDMRLMDKVLEVDRHSHLALIEAGAIGPGLEAQLATHGLRLGHFPDSFEFSTLGGWIATRSAGMQSDGYGRIEDMVIALHAVTGAGELAMQPVPATSAGPDLSAPLIGSEGSFGVITRAWMQVHKIPAKKKYVGFLFRRFSDGVSAIHACYAAGVSPELIRLQDEGETELASHMRLEKGILDKAKEWPIKKALSLTGYERPAVMVAGFEGEEESVNSRHDFVAKIFKKFGAFPLGESVGDTWSRDKYNTPYLRDYVMDYDCFADVAETATSWKNLVPLHQAVLKALKNKLESFNLHGYVGCHLSHSYKTGACLYFTWAIPSPKENVLECYYDFKKEITNAIVAAGGTLSHHHAVGTDHLPWLAKEIGATGELILKGMKSIFDPEGLFNPGALDTKREHPHIGKI
jgi:alkyldihydroxyacetonephosphate synthase